MKKLLIITTLSLAATFAMADETADPAQGSTPATKSVPATQSTPAVRSTPATPATPTKGTALQANNLYNEGTQALNESRWDDAVGKFDSVIKNGSGNTAGALYWKAYGLKQLGRRSEAQQSVSELARRFPTSRWNKDAKVLMSTRNGGAFQPPTPPPTPDSDDADDKERDKEDRERDKEDREREKEDREREKEDRQREKQERQNEREERAAEKQSCGENEELKLLAINNLMNSDSERAFPLLEKILNNPATCRKMQDRALFVLAQSSSPKAQQIMANIAKGQQLPQLQRSAINYLGIHGGSNGMKILEDLYKSGINVEAKKQILNSFGINGQRDKLLSVVKSEKEPALIRAAINGLGISGGCDELMQLYKSTADVQTKTWVLDSFIVCGGSQQFAEVARTESDPKLRIKAIRGIGISGGRSSLLMPIYDGSKDYDTKRAVLEALFIGGNSKALVELAKKETDPQMRKRIVEKLSIMGDKEASDYMIQILEKD
jgi:HEAT repeat protein